MNIYTFRLLPGCGKQILFLVAFICSILLILFCIFICLVSPEWGTIAVMLFLIFTNVLFIYFLVGLTYRKLDVNLFEDRIAITFVRFLFLDNKAHVLRFSDIVSCKVMTVWGYDYDTAYLKMAMNNGRTYRISSALKMFKKIEDYSAVFDIEKIAANYEWYKANRR